jgi:hypothetical protein
VVTGEPDFEEWLAYGHGMGWVGAPLCLMHDGLPMTASEEAEIDDGGDPCVHGLRLYEDETVRQDVESNHAPSVWRASNRGLTASE